jgi:hypothetical protein
MDDEDVLMGLKGGAGEAKTNPFASIWLHPKRTVQRMVEADPSYMAVGLVGGSAALEVIAHVTQAPQPVNTNTSIAYPVAAGAGILFGVIGMYVFGWVYQWVGAWFGGTGTTAHTRAGIAWAKCPSLICALIGVVLAFLPVKLPMERSYAVFGCLLMGSLWSSLMQCGTLAGAHGFSVGRGLVTVLTGHMLLAFPVVIALMIAVSVQPDLITEHNLQLPDIATLKHTVQEKIVAWRTGSGSEEIKPLSLDGMIPDTTAAELTDMGEATDTRVIGILQEIHEAMADFQLRGSGAGYTTIDILVQRNYIDTSDIEITISPPFYLYIPGYFIMQHVAPTAQGYCVEARPRSPDSIRSRFSVDASGVIRTYTFSGTRTSPGCTGNAATAGGDVVKKLGGF